MGLQDDDGGWAHPRSDASVFNKGEGAIHIVTGGGGATFKPFADQQGYADRTAPKQVFDALATRALMNHFLILDVSPQQITVKTYRVCPKPEAGKGSNPRWKSHKKMWDTITLECDGKKSGTTLFEEFAINKN